MKDFLRFFLLTLCALAAPCHVQAAQPDAPRPIKVYRVGSSSFSYMLTEQTRAIVEAGGKCRLICDDKRDSAGYTRLDQFVTRPGLYEEWLEQRFPRIEAGGYRFVIFQTIGWFNLKPEQHHRLCAEIISDLAGKIRRTGAQVVLYDKCVPLQYEQKEPKARTWCGRYPEGYRLNYLLHVMAASSAGIERIIRAWDVYLEIWTDPNLMGRLKASAFSKEVFLEADAAFAKRIARQ